MQSGNLTVREKIQQSSLFRGQVNGRFQLAAPYGTVENAGCPKDFKPEVFELRLTDANFVGCEDQEFIVTSQPPVKINATLKDCPDGWAECYVSGALKRKILSTPGYPSPIRRPPQVNHRITESPGKGLRMFATRDLRAGELVIVERPLMIVPHSIRPLSDIPEHYTVDQAMQAILYDWERGTKVLFGRMDPFNQEAFMSLANSHQSDGSGPITGRIRTNGFEVEELMDTGGRSTSYGLIFNDLSRMNDSCSPNVKRTWDMVSFAMGIRASRDIKKDEEITIQYCELLAPAEERQTALVPYGIECTCNSCANPTVSGPLRAKCREISQRAQAAGLWAHDLEHPDSPNVRPLIGDLITFAKEGLQSGGSYGYTLLMLMMTYAAIGDVKNTMAYAKKFDAWYLCETGEEGDMDVHGLIPMAELVRKVKGMSIGKGKQ